MRIRKAVIPAAGLGTRFLPASKAQPKEMVALVDRPAIQYVVEEAASAGIEDVLVITSPAKRALEDHFDRAPELERELEAKGKTDALADVRAPGELVDMHFVRQGRPLGLGHAIGMARRHVGDEPFAVLLPDDIVHRDETLLADMIAVHERTGTSVLALREVSDDEIGLYGSAAVTAVDGAIVRIDGIVEKPPRGTAPSNLASFGRYILTPDVFDALDRVEPGAGGEIQLTDAVARLIAGPGVHGLAFSARVFDVGTKLDFLRATVELALERPDLGPAFREVLARIVRREGIG